tara:strand:- start:73 stop:300 length:228 start_codon:yes stop_codon:yes gene_type:complete
VNVIEDTDDEDVISVIVEVSEDEDKEIENNKALKKLGSEVKLEKNEELVDIKIIDLPVETDKTKRIRRKVNKVTK